MDFAGWYGTRAVTLDAAAAMKPFPAVSYAAQDAFRVRR